MNTGNKTLKMSFLWFCFFLIVFSIGAVYAMSSSYRVNSGQVGVVDESGICKRIKRIAAGDIFIPTNSSTEWELFRQNAGGMLMIDCSGWISGLCSGIEVYADDLPGIYNWKTSYTSCMAPQCDGGSPNKLVADNNVDFSQYPARNACKSIGGRLPTLSELECIKGYRDILLAQTGIQRYWSSQESSDYPVTNAVGAVFGGMWYDGGKANYFSYVRCVR